MNLVQKLGQVSLTLAPDGDVLTATDSANGNWNYAYDAFNRLVCSNLVSNGSCSSPTSGAATYSYVYDRFGNRLQQNTSTGGPYHFSANFTGNGTNNNNRMDGFSYDAAGNLLNDGFHQYFYDAENHLIQVDGTLGTCTTATACYNYDAEGHRVHRSGYLNDTCDTTGKRDYVFDISGNWTAEVNSNGTACVGEVYAAGRRIARTGGATRFPHTDWLGTMRVENAYGFPISSLTTCTSLAFGDGQSCNSTVDVLRFTGKERDPESGLDNFGARYNASSVGRFMSPDPGNASGLENQDDPQSWNGYSYVRNNPVNLTDPDGRDYRVCVDNGYGGQNCTSYPNFWDFQKATNASGATLNGNDQSGQILANGKDIGSYHFFVGPGVEGGGVREDTILAPVLFGGIFGGLKAGFRGIVEGIFGGGAKAAVEEGAVVTITDAAASNAGLAPGTWFNTGRGLLGGEARLTIHAAEQAAGRGVTRAEIEDALSMVAKQETARGSVFRFIGQVAEVRVNRVTGNIVTVIRFIGRDAPSPLH